MFLNVWVKKGNKKGKNMFNKSIAVLSVMFANLFSLSSSGSIVFEINPTQAYISLAYSSAFSSNGDNWQRQSGAQRIVFDQSHQLSGLRWWGAMDNFFQSGNENLAGFEIVLWNEDFTKQVVNQNLTIEQVKANETSMSNINGVVYEFFSTFDHFIKSGTYYLNIGALYYAINDENPWGGNGVDQWVWAAGQNNMYDQGSSKDFLVTSNYPHTGWGVWTPTPVNIGNLTFQGGAARMYAVPEAGALCLLGLAGIVGRKRRR